ncbi:hypothetical protein D9611_009370 [Ephemerocybe angulata]|uniref:Uncharacterized protein n=1 Tax=Ephemerocybe angulata TaxID=980116 RepID=A0A8H5BGN7_9AGAR|nr:hypothetical protein D9611_009370 [Tulosesus angulatus]
MSNEQYDKFFPRFIPFEEGKHPLPEGVLPPATNTPRYELGWMIRVPQIRDLHPNYIPFILKVIWKNWRANDLRPKTRAEMDRLGYQVPELWRIGNNCVWIGIARNHPNMMRILLASERNRVKVVNQAIIALGLTPETFAPLSTENLMWLRWEKGRKFPDLDYPCVAEHLWISRRGVAPGNEGSGVPSTHPPVSKEMGTIIECRHFRRGATRLCEPRTSSEMSQQ